MFLYSAVSSPLDRSKRFTLHPRQTCSFRHQLLWEAFQPRSNYARRLVYTHISTSNYSQILIYTAECTGASWREQKCPVFEMIAKGFEPGLSHCESGILPLSYCAPHHCDCMQHNLGLYFQLV